MLNESIVCDNYEQLKARGITPYWCVHHGMTISMYYADPDGNQMEFQVETFGSSEEANAFMCGPINAANPIGVEYDPEDWLARMRAGAPPSDFLVRRVHEPISPIRGALDAAPHGAVILVFQDESNTVVTGERKQTTVAMEKGDGTLTLEDEVVVPSDANELRLFIPIIPDGITTAGHPAHPAWITRKVLGDSVDQIGYFAGPEEPFAELFGSYLALTKKTIEEIPDDADAP